LGIKELATGIFEGVSGLVTQPVNQAKSGGVEGFFTGLGKGLIGVVVKPTVGILDLASRTTEGIQNTPNAVITGKIEKIRASRYFPPNRQLIEYSVFESEGQELFFKINDGKFISCQYITHVQYLKDNYRVFVSNCSVINTNQFDMVIWNISYEHILCVEKLTQKKQYIRLYISEYSI